LTTSLQQLNHSTPEQLNQVQGLQCTRTRSNLILSRRLSYPLIIQSIRLELYRRVILLNAEQILPLLLVVFAAELHRRFQLLQIRGLRQQIKDARLVSLVPNEQKAQHVQHGIYFAGFLHQVRFIAHTHVDDEPKHAPVINEKLNDE
jgi:hypothetical protein